MYPSDAATLVPEANTKMKMEVNKYVIVAYPTPQESELKCGICS